MAAHKIKVAIGERVGYRLVSTAQESFAAGKKQTQCKVCVGSMTGLFAMLTLLAGSSRHDTGDNCSTQYRTSFTQTTINPQHQT